MDNKICIYCDKLYYLGKKSDSITKCCNRNVHKYCKNRVKSKLIKCPICFLKFEKCEKIKIHICDFNKDLEIFKNIEMKIIPPLPIFGNIVFFGRRNLNDLNNIIDNINNQFEGIKSTINLTSIDFLSNLIDHNIQIV